jgi:hypothetical protein
MSVGEAHIITRRREEKNNNIFMLVGHLFFNAVKSLHLRESGSLMEALHMGQ